MTTAEKKLLEIVEDGQSGRYKKDGLIRCFSGDIRTVIELKNPLSGSILVYKVDKFLEIINPNLSDEIKWFETAQEHLKLWVNDILIVNRILGIENDNTYDERAFERVILEHFHLKSKPNPNEIIEINFKTMLELVELGIRRFRL